MLHLMFLLILAIPLLHLPIQCFPYYQPKISCYYHLEICIMLVEQHLNQLPPSINIQITINTITTIGMNIITLFANRYTVTIYTPNREMITQYIASAVA